MDYESLKFIMQEQTKVNYNTIKIIMDSMTNEEYQKIPIINLSEEQLSFVRSYAVCDIPKWETNNCLNGRPFFNLYYVAPTLFKVFNPNNKK